MTEWWPPLADHNDIKPTKAPQGLQISVPAWLNGTFHCRVPILRIPSGHFDQSYSYTTVENGPPC